MTIIENGESGASVRAKLNSALARYDQDGFANVAALLADTVLEYGQVSAGDIIRTRSEGFAYTVAASSASDHHVITAGGIKLYVLPVSSGYDVRAFGAIGDGVTNSGAAIQKALYVAGIDGGDVYAPSGIYVSTVGLVFPQGVILKGEGHGDWDTVYHNRPKTWTGTTILFKGTGTKARTISGITSGEVTGGWREDPGAPGSFIKLTSFMNTNGTGSAPATPRAFSAAIASTPGEVVRNWGLRNLRISPWMGVDGIDGYSSPTTTSLGDEWDVGLLVEDTEYGIFEGIQVVGYWRIAGMAMVNSDFAIFGAQERNRFVDCKFQGLTGSMIRSGDQWAVSALTASTVEIRWSAETYWPAAGKFTALGSAGFVQYQYTSLSRNGDNLVFNGVTPNPSAPAITNIRAPNRSSGAAGSFFLNVLTSGLDHVSGARATSFGLPSSKAFEISGFPARGLQFFNWKAQTGEAAVTFWHNCESALFSQCQFEGDGYLIASPISSSSTAVAPVGDTRGLRFISSSISGCDTTLFTPRSIWDDQRQINAGGLSGNFELSGLPGQDMNLIVQTGKSFYVCKPNGDSALRVSESGNVLVQNGGQFSFTGSTAIINADAGQNFRLRNGTTTRLELFGSSGNFGAGVDNAQSWGTSSSRWSNVYSNQFRPGNGTAIWASGGGTPEGVIAAPVGSLFTRTDGGASTTLYVKESGTGNTGWVAK